MSTNEVVRNAYNSIADTYLQWVSRSTAQEEKAKLILKYLNSNSRVLDLGCGAGVPVAKLLSAEVGHIIGVDISEKQIELAKQNVPNAEFVVADMASLQLGKASFDAVLAFFTIFHLPREQHKAFIQNVYSWLKPGGLFLVNFTATSLVDTQSDFLGATNFFSGWDTTQSEKLVTNAGFQVIDREIRAQGDVDDTTDPDNGKSFLWVLARKTV